MMLDALVIGGGQAGLAAAYHLRNAGVSYLVLDSHLRTGDSWRQRWNGLRLFSPQRYNALPGLLPPGDPWSLPSREELADYLEAYVRNFDLAVVYGQEVISVDHTDGYFTATTAAGAVHRSRQLIVATGAYHTPRLPAKLAAVFPSGVDQYHSSELRAVDEVADSDTAVLVVGAGASGQQLSSLALDAGARVILAGPRVANLPRRLLGKDIYWWLYRSGMMHVRTDLPPASFFPTPGGGTVTVGEREDELVMRPHLRRVTEHLLDYTKGELIFGDNGKPTTRIPWPGERRGVIFWCTGFRNSYSWLPPAATDERGALRQRGGSSATIPGLYFLGLENLRHPNSTLVGGVGRDAARIVERLQRTAKHELV